eukprot:2883684-Rhodomonas_salina.1
MADTADADAGREGSPVIDQERRMSLGERQNSQRSLSSLWSDVLEMMKQAGINTPSGFFNTLEEQEVGEKELMFVYSERNFYATNGSTDKYKEHFSISMLLLWNDEDKTEREGIKNIHGTYVADFKKKNK